MSPRRYTGRKEPIALIMGSADREKELNHPANLRNVSRKAALLGPAYITSRDNDGVNATKNLTLRDSFAGPPSSPDASGFPARANILAEIERKKKLEAEMKQKLIYTLQERIWLSQALDRAHQAIKDIVVETGGTNSPFHDEYFATPEPPRRPISIYDRPPRRNTLRKPSATITDWPSTNRGGTSD